MSPLDFYRQLLGSGVPEDTAYAMAAKFEADREAELKALYVEMAAKLVAGPPESKDERRRRISRETSARHRASRNVTDVSPTPVTQDVTECHPVTESDTQTASLARVRDIYPRLDILPDLTKLNLGAGAFENPGREELDALEARLTEAVGPALASKAVAPKLFDLSPIVAMLKAGKGPPADLEADVVPALRAAAARSAPGTIKTWGYFTSAIREARDRRLSGAPEVAEVIPMPRAQGPPSLVDRIAADNAEARRLAFERMDRANG